MIRTHYSTVTVDGSPYRAVLEEGPHNWSAYVPALPGLAATGANRAELRAHLKEAIAFHLEGLQRRGAGRPRQRVAR